MPRYPHWLEKISRSQWPKAVICVDCCGVTSESPTASGCVTESLASWHAVCLRSQEGEYHVVGRISGGDADGFWRTMAEYLVHPGKVWLVSWRCTRVWSLLDLWARMESGYVRCHQRDYRADSAYAAAVQSVRRGQRDTIGPVSTGAVHRLLGQTDGFIALEDPPNILACKAGEAQGSVTWVDLRNYGCEVPAEVPAGAECATWLARWFVGAADYLHRYRLGSLCATAGSQAMTGWRTSYYDGGTYCETLPGSVTIAQSAYMGGRCECARVGHEARGVWHIDRRSAYGYHCAASRLPVRLQGRVDCDGLRSDDSDNIAHHAIMRVMLKTLEPAYPMRREGIVIYPIGRYETVLCGPELVDALALGRVHNVLECWTYDMEPALSQYALACYAARCEADAEQRPDISTLFKRLLVSLPGKLGQRSRRWQYAPDIPAVVTWGEWIGGDEAGNPVRYRSIAGMVQRDSDDGLAPDAVPAIAAWITSAARYELLCTIRIAGWSEVLYYDTDSIICTETGYRRIEAAGKIHTGVLGAWTVRNGPCDVTIYGVKCYEIDGELTCAGLPRGVQVASGDGQHYWYSPSPVEQLQSRLAPAAVAQLRSYMRRAPYRHGNVSDDGSVTPYVLEEW